jgi:hypothetical protein
MKAIGSPVNAPSARKAPVPPALLQARRMIERASTRDRGRLLGLWWRWSAAPSDGVAQAAFDTALEASIAEEPALRESTDWREMVRQLTVGNEAVCRTARRVLQVADEAGDDPSVDLLTQRLQVHEKYAWMLRSLLQ